MIGDTISQLNLGNNINYIIKIMIPILFVKHILLRILRTLDYIIWTPPCNKQLHYFIDGTIYLNSCIV